MSSTRIKIPSLQCKLPGSLPNLGCDNPIETQGSTHCHEGFGYMISCGSLFHFRLRFPGLGALGSDLGTAFGAGLGAPLALALTFGVAILGTGMDFVRTSSVTVSCVLRFPNSGISYFKG